MTMMHHIPMINMEETGKKIQTLRRARGISVRELQHVFGFATPQAIYKWQQGAAMPTLDNLVILAAALEVSIDKILVVDNGAA